MKFRFVRTVLVAALAFAMGGITNPIGPASSQTPTTATLIPNEDGSVGSWSSPPLFEKIDEDPAMHDGDNTLVFGPDKADGVAMFVTLSDTPTDFDPAGITSIIIDEVARRTIGGDDTINLYFQVFKADEVTSLTDEIAVLDVGETYLRSELAVTQQGSPTKADWDGARLRIRQDYTQVGDADSRKKSGVTAARVSVVYDLSTPACELEGHYPEGFTVPTGETCIIRSDVTSDGSVIVEGTLTNLVGNTDRKPFSLTFTNINEADFVANDIDNHSVIPGNIGLHVHEGTLDVQGTPKLPWARANGGLVAGATTLELGADPVGWQVGDETAIAPTESPTVFQANRHTEVRSIVAISGRTLTLDSGLTYDHPAVTLKPGMTMTAEVGNLTRDVRIEGTPTGRSHITIFHSATTIKHVQLRHMGPTVSATEGVEGVYPLHWHNAGEDGRGSLAEGVVIRDSGNRGFVPHDSHGVVLRSNVTYNVRMSPYWWNGDECRGDDALPLCASDDALWEGNLALHTETVTNRDAAFTLNAGSGNAANGNVAAGVWTESRGGIGFTWNNFGWQFDDDVAHNVGRAGFLWYNPGQADVANRFVAYHGHGAVIDQGAYNNPYAWLDFTWFGFKKGVKVHGTGENHLPLLFQDGHIDMAGLSTHAFRIIDNSKNERPDTPMVVERVTMLGYTDSALIMDMKTKKRTAEFRDSTFSGNEVWFNDLASPETLATFSPAADGWTEARQKDQPGTFYPAWNASVTE